MRITTNMLVQQLSQAAKSEGAQKLEVGAVITARISEVLNGVLTLDIGNGIPIAAKDLTGRDFYPGQTVSFEFVGVDENGVMQIRPNSSESPKELVSQNLGLILKELNLPDTQGNRELIRTLSAYRIPLSSENIKAAQELNTQAKGIVQLSDQAGTLILAENESEPLKQIAAKLIQVTGSSGKGTTLEPASVPTPASAHSGKVIAEQMSVSASNPVVSDGINETSTKIVIDKSPVQISVESTKPETIENTVLEGTRGNELKELLKQLTFEKIGFILKNQLPNDLGTFDTMEKLILGKKVLGTQLNELLMNLKDDATAAPLRDAIQNVLKAVHIHQSLDPFEFQKQLKSLNQELVALSERTMGSDMGNQKVKESLTEVKNSLDFLGRLSESATYLHVPVNLGQGTKPMDLYVQRDKSGKKKVNPNDTKIFISLETNHMDTVQCMVEVQEKKLNVGFKLSDIEALTLIGRYFEPLKESLSQLGYTDIMIHGIIYQKPMNLMDITQEPPADLRRIDMKV